MRRHEKLGLVLMLVLLTLTATGAIAPSHASDPPQNKYRLVITVTSADRNEPVEGASVTVKWVYDPAMEPIRLETQTTDQDGKVWVIPAIYGGIGKIEPKAGQRFDITVTHPDFDDAYRPVPIRRDTRAGDIPVGVSLKRKAGAKLVAVQVVAAGDRAPVYDATVKLRGTISATLFSGSTNPDGRALITVTEGDDYDVTVTHTGYEPVSTTLKVKMYDDQKEYDLSFEMKRTTEDAPRILRVFVRSRNKEGKEVPVHYAEVTLGSNTKMTDYLGKIEIKHNFPPGELIKVNAEANHYKSGSDSFTVGTRVGRPDKLTIWLEQDTSGLESGEYDADTAGYPATWTLTISGSSVSGNGTWDCCPGHRVDRLEGSIEGQTITITRHCQGQGYDQPCVQVYTGTISGNGASGDSTMNGNPLGHWSMTLKKKK